MSTAELKEKLIAEINKTDNDELLIQISHLIELESNAVAIYEMSPGEIEAVEDGFNQIKNGQWISDEEANRQVGEWLKK